MIILELNNKHLTIPVTARSGARVFAAWLLGSSVEVPVKAWMFFDLDFVLCCPV
jgi:hypothetical protein